MKLTLHTDGGARGNPGPSAYGFVVTDISDLSHQQAGAGIILKKCGKYCGICTNNQVEYDGLVAGLTWIHQNYPLAEIQVIMDSLLIVNQIKGIYKVKNVGLLPKYQEAMKLFLTFPIRLINHTFREGNKIADQLVNDAIDNHQ